MPQPFKDLKSTHVIEIMNAADGLAYAQFFNRDMAGNFVPFMYGFHRKSRAECARGVEALLKHAANCPCVVRPDSGACKLPDGAEAVCNVFQGQIKESQAELGEETAQAKELRENAAPYYVFNICDNMGMPFYFSALNYVSPVDAVADFGAFQVSVAENTLGGADSLKEIQ